MGPPVDGFKKQLTEAANAVAEKLAADVLIYNGPLYQPYDGQVIDLCGNCEPKRPNVYMVLVTFGGSAHAAYRIARCLQRNYKKVIICIPGACASAGTLVAIGAHELVMNDHGVLGPLDVQIRKSDAFFETTSGLTTLESLETLRSESFGMFEATMLDLREHFQGQITLKTAMETATKLTTGLFATIYSQIDPIRLGEDGRLTRIAEEYGARLERKSQNLHSGALQQLVAEYPTHAFEIDREEASELFKQVRVPGSEEGSLIAALGPAARTPATDSIMCFLSDALPKTGGANAKDSPTNTNGSEPQAVEPHTNTTGQIQSTDAIAAIFRASSSN